MAKCVSCGERKGNRLCLALHGNICSLCCGTKREKEIACFQGCEYLKKGSEYQIHRELEKRIASDLHAESEDVFKTDEATDFVMPLEGFFVDQLYSNRDVKDGQIYDSLSKAYGFRVGILPVLKAENRVDELVFQALNELDRNLPGLADNLKTRAILRILKSIKYSSGGVLGNRNYLEMIYSQHTGKGKWADLFMKLESEEKE